MWDLPRPGIEPISPALAGGFLWDLPRPGIEPMSLALAGGFLTTASPGKSLTYTFCILPFNKYLSFYHLPGTVWGHWRYSSESKQKFLSIWNLYSSGKRQTKIKVKLKVRWWEVLWRRMGKGNIECWEVCSILNSYTACCNCDKSLASGPFLFWACLIMPWICVTSCRSCFLHTQCETPGTTCLEVLI